MNEEITAEALRNCHMQQTLHGHGRGFFFYGFRCIEHPRLQRIDRYERKDRSVKSTWSVDGVDVESFESAIIALNKPVEITDEERATLAQVPAEFTDLRKSDLFEKLYSLANKGLVGFKAGKVRRT